MKSDIKSKPITPRDKNTSARSNYSILNNGFLKPQVVLNNSSSNNTSLNNNNNNNKPELYNSSSSLSTVKNKSVVGNERAKTSVASKANGSSASINSLTNVDTLLGSKNARDAFFERLRVTEYLNKSKKADCSRPGSGKFNLFEFSIFINLIHVQYILIGAVLKRGYKKNHNFVP